MKTIGLTGGIGAGKSLVANIFQTLGVPVFEADKFGRQVLDADSEVISAVKKLLGDEAYQGGSANRKLIASRVFDDNDLLERLNAIIHPAVGRAFTEWKSSHMNEADYCLREAAILFESGSHQDCEQVICVVAPEDLRYERVMKRDGVDRDEVEARMRRQWPQEKKVDLSDHIIHNDGVQPLIPQVWHLHHLLRSDK